MVRLSPEVVSLLNRGPFPDRIDPWAEAGFTFQQIHGGMISALLQQLREPLASQGYFATREAALLISEARKPDIWIVDKSPDPEARPSWDYQVAAEGAHAEVGLAADVEALEGIHIYAQDGGELVTVLELVSPSNKTDLYHMSAYHDYRYRLLAQGVHVVEIDPTRSVKRLFDHRIAQIYAYHIAIHLNDGRHFVVGSFYDQPLRRFALPLRQEVVALEPQAAYQASYREIGIADQLHHRSAYTEEHLPFPSLLTARDRAELLVRVEAWRERLAQLSATHENGA
jgi:hypothetical protein